jgi:hypothetical protein
VRIVKPLRILALAVAAFGAGFVVNAMLGRDYMVRTTVVNETDRPVRSFTVTYETCGAETQIVGQSLAPGQSRIVAIQLCGEGGYTLKAVFADGQVVEGGGGYIESGAETTDRITAKGIISDASAYRVAGVYRIR